MQQSGKPDLAAGFLSVDLGAAAGVFVGFVAASNLRWRKALVLTCNVSRSVTPQKRNLLERICGSLPLAAYLNTNTDAFIYVFCATLIVDTKLESITVFNLEWARVLRGG